ncbi:MAG: CoA transferase, partial [Dehalococcoidia bacterium]
IVDDAYLQRRGFFREVEHPRLGRTVRAPGPPFRFAGREVGVQAPAPEPGQDNEAIWVQELGLTGAMAATATPREAV